MCYELHYVPPPNSHAEVLTPSTLEYGFIQSSGIYRAKHVKVRSLGWTVIQYDLCPWLKGKLGHRVACIEGRGCAGTGRMKMVIYKP